MVSDLDALCVCGHPIEDHDGTGEECALCEELAPEEACREFRPVTLLDREIEKAVVQGDEQQAAFLRGLRLPDGSCKPFPGERK